MSSKAIRERIEDFLSMPYEVGATQTAKALLAVLDVCDGHPDPEDPAASVIRYTIAKELGVPYNINTEM